VGNLQSSVKTCGKGGPRHFLTQKTLRRLAGRAGNVRMNPGKDGPTGAGGGKNAKIEGAHTGGEGGKKKRVWQGKGVDATIRGDDR